MWQIFAPSQLEIAAFGVEAPRLLLAGLVAVALAALVAIARGPRRLRVPNAGAPTALDRFWPDFPFLV